MEEEMKERNIILLQIEYSCSKEKKRNHTQKKLQKCCIEKLHHKVHSSLLLQFDWTKY